MAVEQTGGLDDLLMGNVTEGSEETSEQIAVRIAASQTRLAALKKDEAVATVYDTHLAQVIKTLPIGLLRFAAWMINLDIASFTILSILSLSNQRAEDILKSTWERVDTSSVSFLTEIKDKHAQAKIAVWCQAIVKVDRQSTTVRLSSLKKTPTEHSQFAGGLRAVMENYLLRSDDKFDPTALDTIARDVAGWVCVK